MNQLAFAVALEAAYRYHTAIVGPMSRLSGLKMRLWLAWWPNLSAEGARGLIRELTCAITHIVQDRPEWVREHARKVGR